MPVLHVIAVHDDCDTPTWAAVVVNAVTVPETPGRRRRKRRAGLGLGIVGGGRGISSGRRSFLWLCRGRSVAVVRNNRPRTGGTSVPRLYHRGPPGKSTQEH